MALYLGSKKIAGGSGGDTLPIGSVVEWYGIFAPVGWLLLNGQAVSRIEYSELFKLYGTAYGSGDGSTTFNLPNKSGRVGVGLDTNDNDFNEIGKTGGKKTHTLTINEMPLHTHDIYDGSRDADKPSFAGFYGANGKAARFKPSYTNLTDDLDAILKNKSTGGSQPHNNLQPYIIVNYIVKAKNIVSSENATKAFVESGSNENGNWIKFSDGTAVCKKTGNIITNINVNTTTRYRSSTINIGQLPLDLISVDYYETNGYAEYTTDGEMAWSQINAIATNENFANIIMLSDKQSNNRKIFYSSIVIGKWK